MTESLAADDEDGEEWERSEVGFSVEVVFDQDDALRGVNMTCLSCNERGYKDANTIVEHARMHLPAEGASFVTISRQFMDFLESQIEGAK